jgi:hypothetical protein
LQPLLGLAGGAVMGQLFDAEVVSEFAEVVETFDDAADIGLENEKGDELVLGENLLRELRGKSQNYVLSEAQGFQNDRSAPFRLRSGVMKVLMHLSMPQMVHGFRISTEQPKVTCNNGLRSFLSEVHMRNKIAVFAICIIAMCLPSECRSQSDDSQVIAVLREGYLHNRSSFDRIQCDFIWQKGFAPNKEAALRGDFSDSLKPVGYGKWLVNGNKVSYSLKCPEESAKITKDTLKSVFGSENRAESKSHDKQKTLVSVPCFDQHFLNNGTHFLNYSPWVMNANLFEGDGSTVTGIRVTPFNPDCFGSEEYSSPGRQLHDCLSGRFKWKYDGVERIAGRDLLLVSFGPDYDTRLGFDPKRGYMLGYQSEIDIKTNKALRAVYWLQAKKFRTDRWFPTKAVSLSRPDELGAIAIRQLNVTHLVVDIAAPDDAFQIVMPSGVRVYSPTKNEWVTTKQGTIVTPDTLAALSEEMRANTEDYSKLVSPAPLLQPDTRLLWALSFAGLTIACFGYYYLRSKRRVSAKR